MYCMRVIVKRSVLYIANFSLTTHTHTDTHTHTHTHTLGSLLYRETKAGAAPLTLNNGATAEISEMFI